MACTIKPMSHEDALLVTEWRYEPPYDFYNLQNDEQDLLEILDPEQRDGHYYSVYQEDEFIGLYEFHVDESICTMGLGLKPELTGHGYGQVFVETGIEFILKEHPEISTIELAVISFNDRAVKVYERCGFTITGEELMMFNGTLHEFIKMENKIKGEINK